jgi:Putative transposase
MTHLRKMMLEELDRHNYAQTTIDCYIQTQRPAALRFFYTQTIKNKKLLYHPLLQTSAATLLEVARDPKHLGAEVGFFSVLNTWNQKLEHHPHVHWVVPAGGLSPDRTHWIPPRSRFFLPVKVLSRIFRGKFVAALKHNLRQETALRRRRACALLLRPLHPSRRHLQPPTRRLGRWPSHLFAGAIPLTTTNTSG